MPTGFFTNEQSRRYGRFTGEPTPDQLARHFHLDDADRAFVAEHRGEHNRLGVAIQLGSVRLLGAFLDDPAEVPTSAERAPANPSLTIVSAPDGPDLSVEPLDKLEEPPSLMALRAAVEARLPRLDLPELILEVHTRTGFADRFTHASEGEARAADIATSVCAVLVAEATNTGFEPLIRRDAPALRRSRLSWVKQNFVRAETLTTANAALVAAQNDIALAREWGGGEVASADGLRFVVPIRTIHAGPNPRYFGRERGVTWYNLASDQYTGLGAITVPGTLRDSLNLLALVLEQETDLSPVEIMSDTAGYTDAIFGVFHLLGYQFSPRIADVGGARFWRVDPKADYGVLNGLAANKINTRLIAEHWDDLLRLAGSLKLGVVRAAGLTRTLQTNDRPTRLARALQELGRLVKTLYLLRYVDDGGCAQKPEAVVARSVSPMMYASLDCTALQAERYRIHSQVTNLTAAQKK